MSVTLTFDQGNSSTKAQAFDSLTLRPLAWRIVSCTDARADLQRLMDTLPEAERHVDAAIGCSVASEAAGRECLAELLATCGADTTMELTAATPVPIRNCYATPATLGPDRLAAAVGAAALFPGRELLVVDLGTACTFDVVTADGRYLGGNIAPGPGMRLRALSSFTARLPQVDPLSSQVPEFGADTPSAMMAGAFRGLLAELLYYSGNGRQRLTVLSGGWVNKMLPLLPADFPCRHCVNLVNEGLNRILHHNVTIPHHFNNAI